MTNLTHDVKQSFYTQKGFSLVEIAIVLTIVGFLATGALFGLGEFRSTQSVKESMHNIEKIKTQLMIFGQVNKFLPCPDTNFDGYEDRSVTSACLSSVGTAPYIDLGIQRVDAQDAWGNFIRYAVNQNTVNVNLICDKRESASYFCNSGFGINWFTFIDTPPFSGNTGGGNYFVCNQDVVSCDAGSIMNAANLESESASIILVAYNEDGSRTLANCASMTGPTLENCNIDLLYHQGLKTSDEERFYDDIVLAINGYEIKKAMLGETIVWDEYPSISGSSFLEPTYEDFDITSTDDQSQIGTTGDDVVSVRRNVDTALDLGAGDDYIAIGNDLDYGAELNTGAGNDTVYIVGQANSNVLLGDGDDAFVLATNLTQELDTGLGNDKVWIQGNVDSGATFELGAGEDVVWLGDASDVASGGLLSDVNGGADYDILILENMTKAEWLADGIFQSYVVNFELVMFSDDGTGTREYIVLP